MTPTYDDLQEQVRYLRGRIEDLTGTEDQVTRLRASLGLMPRHAAVLALLVNTNRGLRDEAIYNAVFEHANGDGPTMGTVKVAISTIRSKVRALGAPERTIPVAFGTSSYSLTPEFREWLSDRLAVAA